MHVGRELLDCTVQSIFRKLLALCTLIPLSQNHPFNYPHKNYADNSIKIVFTNSELPKIIGTSFTSAHYKKKLEKTDEPEGKKVTFDRTLEIIRIILELRSQIPKSAPDADTMRIIAASKKCGLFWSHWICEWGISELCNLHTCYLVVRK